MRFNSRTLSLLALAVTALTIHSCCRSTKCKCEDQWGQRVDDCTPKHYGPYYLGEVRNYLYFKPGSWWVYKNDISGETDSIYTVTCDTIFTETTGTDKKWLSLSYSTVNSKLRSDKYNVDYYYQEQATYPDVTDFKYGHWLWRTAILPSKAAPPALCFTHPFTKDYSKTFIELIPSMVIQGTTYTDVAVFDVGGDESIPLPTGLPYIVDHAGQGKYYWAKDVGLVQMECLVYRQDTQGTFTQKWELTKSHILQ